MAKPKPSKTRMAIRETAIQALEKHGDNPEVRRQMEALVGSVGDTLSDEVILEELKALESSGIPFQEVFANASPSNFTGRARS